MADEDRIKDEIVRDLVAAINGTHRLSGENLSLLRDMHNILGRAKLIKTKTGGSSAYPDTHKHRCDYGCI